MAMQRRKYSRQPVVRVECTRERRSLSWLSLSVGREFLLELGKIQGFGGKDEDALRRGWHGAPLVRGTDGISDA